MMKFLTNEQNLQVTLNFLFKRIIHPANQQKVCCLHNREIGWDKTSQLLRRLRDEVNF